MKITVRLAQGEQAALELLNAFTRIDARQLEDDPSLPDLYDSGVVYRLEPHEQWSDVLNTLIQGHEDCDSLAPYRAGELIARGWRAIKPDDPGWELASRLRPDTIDAEVFLRTRAPVGVSGEYHVVTRFWLNGQVYEDDPSARLGMRDHLVDPSILQRWERLGVRPLARPHGIRRPR